MKFRSWCKALVGMPVMADPKYDSTPRVLEGWWRGWSFAHTWRDSNGNRNVPYLYFNDKRKLNLNWYDNDWNANYRFLAVRKSLLHPTHN